jgi:hypothetical protein
MSEQASAPYEPETIYLVQLARPVKVGPFKYLPRERPRLTGQHLNLLIEENGADAVTSAEPV